MVLAVLIFLNAFLGVNANPHKKPCEGKAVGDPCMYTNTKGICCTMVRNAAQELHKFCKSCEWPGHPIHSECTQRSEYIGCFRRPEDGIVYQVCHGQKIGSDCKYHTAGYSRGGRSSPEYNTTGTCMAHYDHHQVMCLEAVGDKDDKECAGKGVGEPCKPKDSTSESAVCVHDSRGRWECMVPKEEKMKFVVCQGQDTDTPCRFNDAEKGVVQGVCYPHDDDDGGMMCGTPVSDDDVMNDADPTAAGAPMTTAAGGLASACAVIVIASLACTN